MRTPARGCTLVICLSRAWSAATIAIIRSVSSDTWVVIARSLLRWVSSVADSLAATRRWARLVNIVGLGAARSALGGRIGLVVSRAPAWGRVTCRWYVTTVILCIARSLLRWVSSVADSLAVTSSNWVAIAWAVVPTGPVAAIVEGLWRALFGL